MREIVVLSGKGGTGKTSLTAAFAALSDGQVLVDCDVDAANLHVVLEPSIQESHGFIGGAKAGIDTDLCDRCGVCADLCRFDAISISDTVGVDPLRCEGCGVCEWNCPRGAISLLPALCGYWYRSETRFGPMLHARLEPAQENSGRLVALLRQQARQIADATGARQILVDGPPGTGCPAISSLTGVDYAIMVTEPTRSGFADLRRAVALADHFDVPVGVIVNKADINPEQAGEIETYARETRRDLLGRIGYRPEFTHAQLSGRTVLEDAGPDLRARLEGIWRRLQSALDLLGRKLRDP